MKRWTPPPSLFLTSLVCCWCWGRRCWPHEKHTGRKKSRGAVRCSWKHQRLLPVSGTLFVVHCVTTQSRSGELSNRFITRRPLPQLAVTVSTREKRTNAERFIKGDAREVLQPLDTLVTARERKGGDKEERKGKKKPKDIEIFGNFQCAYRLFSRLLCSETPSCHSSRWSCCLSLMESGMLRSSRELEDSVFFVTVCLYVSCGRILKTKLKLNYVAQGSQT